MVKKQQNLPWKIWDTRWQPNIVIHGVTGDHCHTNSTNKFNAENWLYKKLLKSHGGDKQTIKKLIEVVTNENWYLNTYSNLTGSKKVELDSLIKYEEEVFKPVILK